MTKKKLETLAVKEYEAMPLAEKEKLVSVRGAFIKAFEIAYKVFNEEKCVVIQDFSVKIPEILNEEAEQFLNSEVEK